LNSAEVNCVYRVVCWIDSMAEPTLNAPRVVAWHSPGRNRSRAGACGRGQRAIRLGRLTWRLNGPPRSVVNTKAESGKLAAQLAQRADLTAVRHAILRRHVGTG
jgi:hypothetical protein